MIYCFDTYYGDNFANTAVVGINDWGDATPSFELTEITTDIQEYESGAFYKRELPCLLSIIEKIPLNTEKDILVIDGYVFLSDDEKLGLGGYLYNELDRKIPVIGVAKNNFHTLNKLKKEIYRGQSKKPLYITTLGFDLEKASFHILNMHGEFRMPTILKYVDSLGREQNI
ncbi:conserved hypothetical protein [Tenacibaculum maritimum]|uniref:endonuclease V n=1 Tax=Tenacibaculum maritimum TaxID=107401 RepID=UPI0012E59922|nr:endonuclease V [Tenacibaculum maritimum]CAA0226717.1 conserved hypothetical protein [Tenacibaculum maritimum]